MIMVAILGSVEFDCSRTTPTKVLAQLAEAVTNTMLSRHLADDQRCLQHVCTTT